ncbi:hypothetical protein FHT40_000512 [Mycolicibacterium sp. BK556]|uniref:hypothetical protein n=1 Tax=unclassified Mycolicibacterium TaxID=2636767 RepID=UPI0016217990|nr:MULTISPECIES: hypothetical protein [unclassified Mycolicibacterium]MBB3600879.1 hypothetical protein [Mycolicibacterium sp. BK556]MBB3630633.1 hypothetical protein [Mycolicibacterium sp. BK607]
MVDNPGNHDRRGTRLVMLAALVLVGATLVVVAITTGALPPWKSDNTGPTAEQSARERCQGDVLTKVLSPSTARFSDLRTEASTLDSDGKDQFSLTLEAPLKDVDKSRITVLNVSGVVNAPSEVGTTLSDHFDCRAYFVDGSLVHTLVLFEHEH